jgi:hypothetical protein
VGLVNTKGAEEVFGTGKNVQPNRLPHLRNAGIDRDSLRRTMNTMGLQILKYQFRFNKSEPP